MTEGVQRRLAAILSADVVGYARLMGAHETATLKDLERHRSELIEPKAHQHRGRIVKLMGDGTLMEFASVVDALTFAVEIQCAMSVRNAGVPEDRQIVFRMGINVGDVIVDGDDIHGDGVNVAARLEGLAEPGGICVRRNVRNQVRDKLDLDFEDLGSVEVKNIARPVRAFKVQLNEKAEALCTALVAPPKERTKAQRSMTVIGLATLVAVIGVLVWWRPWATDFEPLDPTTMERPLPAKPSIAVLAFDDLSQGADKQFLSDAISEGVITALSLFPQLFVIAKNSSFYYRDKMTDVREIARELGVRYLLEGSQQQEGNRLRVTVQLIDAVAGNHVWAETYNREIADIFTVQDEIVQAVASTVGGKLLVVASREAARADSARLEAFSSWLKGFKLWHDWTHEANLQALASFENAVEADPELSYGHIGLAWVYINGFRYGWSNVDREEALARALENAKRGLELAPDDYFSHMSMAYVLMQAGESEEAILKFRRALELNPNSTDVMGTLAEQLGYVGESAEAIGLLESAMRRDPHHPDWMKWTLGGIQYSTGDCEAALTTMRRMSGLPYPAYVTMAGIFVCLGRLEEAHGAVAEVLKHDPDYSVARFRSDLGKNFQSQSFLDRWSADLAKAGLPE